MRTQLVIGLTALMFGVSAARGAAPTTDPVGEGALAERFAQMAQSNLATRSLSKIVMTEAAALLQAACKLDPTDPRFAKLRAEATLTLQDKDAALEALKQCAALDGSDQVAQVQIIDLYASRMQSADEKIKYFQGLLAAEKLSPEVKGHVAYRLAREMLDRGEDAQAREMVDKALSLNALDPDALELNEQFKRKGPIREHVQALLGLLLCNPAQPAVSARLADDLAGEGLTNEAATWYSNSISSGNRLNLATDPDLFLNYVAELLIGNQIKSLDTAIDSLLQKDPTNAGGLYLKVMLARRGEDKDAIEKAVDTAREGFLERLYGAYRSAMKVDPPTTRPTGELAERTGDVVAQAKQLKESGNQDAIGDYAAALTDLAWLEIYFIQQPANAAPQLAALHELLADDDIRFARLEGWSLLNSGKSDEAKVKLSAVADRDPLSAVGIIRIASKDPAQAKDAKTSAMTLVNDNRSGLLAAMLLDGLRDLGASVDVSSNGNDIKADLEKFPKAWFTFLDKPDDFYLINCQAMHVSHQFDEPMLAVVNVQNIGPFDIAIGQKGALKPDLWFDVGIRGPQAPQNLSGVAYDRMSKRLVIRHGEGFQQVVRLDQPKLAEGLSQNPTVAYSLLFSLVTNPMPGPGGNIAPGPGGQRTPFKKPVERAANPLNPQRQQILQNNLTNRTSDVRLSTMSLLAAYAKGFATSQDEKMQAQARQLADTIGQLNEDPSQPVATWSRLLQLSMEAPANRAGSLKQMAASDYWPQRLLAANGALASGEAGKETLQKLAGDSEPIVKKFAAAALDDLAHPSTRPTTAPSAPGTVAPGTAAPSTQPTAPGQLNPIAPASGPTIDLKL